MFGDIDESLLKAKPILDQYVLKVVFLLLVIG